MPPSDPRRLLVRLLARLEERSDFVTLAELERAAGARRAGPLPVSNVARLVEEAVADMLLLTDRRLVLDRASGTLAATSIYRVNRRHPFARETLL